MTPTEVVRAQLLAARASIDAALALMAEPVAAAAEAACPHPESKRQAMPTSGRLGQFMCRACMTIVPGEAAPDGT